MSASDRQIDLNADLAEGVGDDDEMLSVVSSANIACGAHAGGPEEMFAALTTARARGVVIGAHPGYADRANFGRIVVPMNDGAIERLIASQLGAATGVAALAGTRIAYVKTHGALYNLAAVDEHVAAAIARAVRTVDSHMILLCPALSMAEKAADAAGLATAAEVFADRAYRADGTLVPRSEPGAVIHDPEVVLARTLDMLETGQITAANGNKLKTRIDSICLHGDTPGAVRLARTLNTTLKAEGWRIAPFAR